VCSFMLIHLSQPFGAIVSSFVKYLSGSEFDHCGMIVLEPCGRTFVLEKTLSGVKVVVIMTGTFSVF
jgi:hypothetical protein